jgi:hypothetical protein
MKHAEIVVMMTLDDYTVTNARQVFDSCVDLPVRHWGFKDNTLSDKEIISIGRRIKEAGKIPVLELVNFSREAYDRAAKLAVEGRFDMVSGGLYDEGLGKQLLAAGIQYMPFCGELIRDDTGILWMHESRAEMLELANKALAAGAYGIDFCCYRHKTENGDDLVRWFKKELPDVLVCAAGGVSSLDRIKFICENNVDLFTTGTALFRQTYVENGSFHDNLKYIYDYIQTL